MRWKRFFHSWRHLLRFSRECQKEFQITLGIESPLMRLSSFQRGCRFDQWHNFLISSSDLAEAKGIMWSISHSDLFPHDMPGMNFDSMYFLRTSQSHPIISFVDDVFLNPFRFIASLTRWRIRDLKYDRLDVSMAFLSERLLCSLQASLLFLFQFLQASRCFSGF